MTIVDVTGGVLGGCWQVTETVVKSSFLDLVQLVGQEGMSTKRKINVYKCYYRNVVSCSTDPCILPPFIIIMT